RGRALALWGEGRGAAGMAGALVNWVLVTATSAGGGPSSLSSRFSSGSLGIAGAFFSTSLVIAATFVVAGALRWRTLAASISASSFAGRSLISQTVYGPWS